MASTRSINLIKKETSPSELGGATPILRRVGTVILIIFILSGAISGGTFFWVQSRQTQLASDHHQYTISVNRDTIKEGLLLAVRQRADVIAKISAGQKDTGKFFAILAQFVPAANISSVSMDDTNKSIVVVRAATLAEAGAVTDAILKLVDANLVSSPTLLAIGFTKDGGLEISLSFVPTL